MLQARSTVRLPRKEYDCERAWKTPKKSKAAMNFKLELKFIEGAATQPMWELPLAAFTISQHHWHASSSMPVTAVQLPNYAMGVII